ncbi:hypothetical protein PSN45_004731 [Yamadazyma tenuis]|uniref:uncharacterized protein n=1 Tax=Candida tenuis TaxID=2315449 RepID=UPI002797CF33|nr:hypothetical protein PSN45_004731 [Yamadazyma tenuis]
MVDADLNAELAHFPLVIEIAPTEWGEFDQFDNMFINNGEYIFTNNPQSAKLNSRSFIIAERGIQWSFPEKIKEFIKVVLSET